MERNQTSSGHRTALALWLRTGRWVWAQVDDSALEVKFNPNHDPKDGRFTFKDGVGTGDVAGMSRPPKSPPRQAGQEDPRIIAFDRHLRERDWAASVENSKNQESYTVRPGDSLIKIAATRTNLTPRGLAWLNGLKTDKIAVGQTLKIPSQASLDGYLQATKDGNALIHYMGAHGGELPPVGKHPTLAEEQFGPGAHVEKRNGYSFTIDGQGRTRLVEGTITRTANPVRDRKVQADAGKPDRLPTDQGSHYIAARFNGPAEAFNHFAQNQNFNQSAYASLENRWANEDKRGRRVYVEITPSYAGNSKRPSALKVSYTVGGLKRVEFLFNRSGK